MQPECYWVYTDCKSGRLGEMADSLVNRNSTATSCRQREVEKMVTIAVEAQNKHAIAMLRHTELSCLKEK
jgi:hypothetical protein